MRDGLGFDLEEGQTVIWIGGKTQYSGVVIYTVDKVNSKRSIISRMNKRHDGVVERIKRIAPNENLVIIDKILDGGL